MPHDLDVHSPLRRGGGGSGAPIVVPLGFMLIALALISVVAFRVRQSNLMVALVLGVIAGSTGLSNELKPFEMDASIKSLPKPLVDALVEIGIMLLVFFAGLSVDAGPALIYKYWRIMIVLGLGQIGVSWGIYSLIGWGSGLCETTPSIVYFGVVCTLSSGSLMHNAMTEGDTAERLHGKVMRGILVIQDILVVLAVTVLPAFTDRPGLHLGGFRRAGDAAAPATAPDYPPYPVDRGAEVGRLIGIFVAIVAVLSLTTYFVLGRAMRFFSRSNELLFIGVMAYLVGVVPPPFLHPEP